MQGYAFCLSFVYACIITLLVYLGVVFYEVFVRVGVCVATDFSLFVFFSPPELINASCTGLLINNIFPFQKKKSDKCYVVSRKVC